MVCLLLFSLASVCFRFVARGAFVFVLRSVGIVCAHLLSLAVDCFCALLRWFASLAFGSEVTVVFVGVTCDEPSGNKQMAHSQIVFSFVFEMDVAIVLQWFPFSYVGFHWPFFNCRSPSFAPVCYRLLLLVSMLLHIRSVSHPLVSCGLFEFASVGFRLFLFS